MLSLCSTQIVIGNSTYRKGLQATPSAPCQSDPLTPSYRPPASEIIYQVLQNSNLKEKKLFEKLTLTVSLIRLWLVYLRQKENTSYHIVTSRALLANKWNFSLRSRFAGCCGQRPLPQRVATRKLANLMVNAAPRTRQFNDTFEHAYLSFQIMLPWQRRKACHSENFW